METKGFEPSTSRMRTERSRKRYSKLPLRDVKNALFQGFAGHRDMTRESKLLVNSTSSLGGDSDAAHLSHPPFFVFGFSSLVRKRATLSCHSTKKKSPAASLLYSCSTKRIRPYSHSDNVSKSTHRFIHLSIRRF